MRCPSIVFAVILTFSQINSNLWASPTTADEAKMVVTGWLKANPLPFDTTPERQISSIETFTDNSAEPIYYVVYLEPSGFVIVSADDLIEPIIGFADDGTYDPTAKNFLGSLVTRDLNGRFRDIHSTPDSVAHIEQLKSNQAQQKWGSFLRLASESNENLTLASSPPVCDDYISDIRVAPLLKSKWGQSWYYDRNNRKHACFNYYTPQLIDDKVAFIDNQIENYPSGCIATAMAQLMRHHLYPDYAIEAREFYISVDWLIAKRRLVRGQGPDGTYNWSDMVFIPADDTTDQQRRAIGAICHDTGVAVGTQYTVNGSGAYMSDVMIALVDTFGYNQAIWGANEGKNIDSQNLIGIINPNLDANSPVILGIQDSYEIYIGHAAVCDGYGYNSSTLYHHLNIGWYGIDDCWYNLPNIACPNAGPFDTITECIYNVFPDCTGEIISGRITDNKGLPIKDVAVTAQKTTDDAIQTTITNNEGIYAFKGLTSYSTYTISADKNGYDFELKEVDTGRSYDGSSVSGNKWGIDFQGYNNCVSVTIGTGTSGWDYPIHTYYHDSRTQVIYLAEEIGMAGTITALALDIENAPDETMENWTIRMKYTDMSEYDNCSFDSTGWTVVYHSDVAAVTGWQTFEFQTPFEYNGTSNLLVDFSHNNDSYTQTGYCKSTRSDLMRSVYACSDSRDGDPLDWSSTNSPAMHCSKEVPNVKLMIGRESQVINNKLIASDGLAGDRFGFSVSINGDYAIVGAPGPDENNDTSGSAYIFKREGSNWIQQDKLAAFPNAYGDYFGCAVSIYDDYAIIGAYGNDIYLGSAYMFKREGTNWIQQDELVGQVNRIGFGNSVSIGGDYAIIGDPKYLKRGTKRYSNNQYGAAYIYKLEGSHLTEQAIVLGSGSELYDRFGCAVSIDGDYAVVGAKIGYGRRDETGAAYTFKREGTYWIEQAVLYTSDGSTTDLFGSSVSIYGDYILIGAPGNNENGNDSGSAYIFKRDGITWTLQTKLTAQDGKDGDLFGSSVFICGDYAVIGAPYDDDDVNGNDCGSVYIFKREGVNWNQKKKLTTSDAENDNRFGCSVSIGGDYIIIGAEGDNDNGHNSGSAYIYRLADITGI